MKVLILLIFNLILAGSTFALEDQFAKKSFKNPLREISVIISDDGFYPNRIVAYQGEKLKIFATTTSSQKQCFVLQKHELFLAVEKGLVNEGEVLLEHAGRFKFFCPASNKEGHITVLEKSNPRDQEFGSNREPASVQPSYWVPRDYDEGF